MKAAYGSNIVFTGHSLGGGLAALMAAFFDKDAFTFDQAPLRASATQANKQLINDFLVPTAPWRDRKSAMKVPIRRYGSAAWRFVFGFLSLLGEGGTGHRQYRT